MMVLAPNQPFRGVARLTEVEEQCQLQSRTSTVINIFLSPTQPSSSVQDRFDPFELSAF